MTTDNISYMTCIVCGDKTNSIFYKKQFLIHRCANCALGITEIQKFSPNTIYTKAYFEGGVDDGYGSYAADKAHIQRHYNKLFHVLDIDFPKEGHVLEIGCAYGYFIEAMLHRYNVIGTDVSLHAVAQSPLSVRSKVAVVDFTDLIPRELFDIIVCFDTIEHVSNPKLLIKQISTFLRPGGVAIITTGAFDSVHANIMGKYWRLLTPPQHLYYFSARSLYLLASQNRLKLEKISYLGKIVPVRLALYQFGRIFPAIRSLIRFIPQQFSININLFDVYTVVFRKPSVQ